MVRKDLIYWANIPAIGLIYRVQVGAIGDPNYRIYIGQSCQLSYLSATDMLRSRMLRHASKRGGTIAVCLENHELQGVSWTIVEHQTSPGAELEHLQMWCDNQEKAWIKIHADSGVRMLNRREGGTDKDNRTHNSAVSAREFDNFLCRLQQYALSQGHCNPPWLYRDADGYRLGERVANVRSCGTYVRGQLDRCRLLENMGFRWCEQRIAASSRRTKNKDNETHSARNAR
jgi:Helicase associated domain